MPENGAISTVKRETRAADPLEEATRFLDQGQPGAALQVLVPLHETYADDPEIAIALGLASLKTNRIARACQVFGRFIQRWPRHRKTEQIQRALDDLADARGHRLRFLGLADDQIDIAVAYEESNAFLAAGQFAEARNVTEAVLEHQPGCTPARNNLSYLLWLDGDGEGARREAERVLADDPGNLQAACHMVRYLCLGGDEEGAKAMVETVKSLPTAGADGAVTKMEALSFLPDDGGVVALYEQAAAPDSAQDATSPMLHHLGAVAHARLGNEAAARSLWHQALRVSPEFELAKTNLDDARKKPAERHGAWPFSLSNWVAARDLADLGAGLQSAGEAGIGAAMRGWLGGRPGAAALVGRLLRRADPVGRDFALMLATHADTPEMNALLVEFALGQDGPDELRLTAWRRALERGLLPLGPVRVWIRGERHFTVPQAHDLHEEGRSDPRVRQLSERLDGGDVERARALVSDLGEELPVARAALARIEAGEGNLSAARAMLSTLLERPRMSRTELAALCEAEVVVLEASGDREGARAWLDVWGQVRSDAPAVARWRKRLESQE
jgi:Flp pilus assembly protein TadD